MNYPNELLIHIDIDIKMNYDGMTWYAQSMNMLEANIPLNILDKIEHVTVTSRHPIYWRDSYLRRLYNLSGISIIDSEINNIDQLPDVEEIVLRNVNLRQFPNILLERTNLKWLDVTDNSIQGLYIRSENNTLEGLDISSNELISLNGIELLTGLRTLYAIYNSITIVNNIDHINYLYLSENNIRSISDNGYNINLIELSISDNKLTSLDGLQQFHELTLLDASMNEISSMREVSELITHGNLKNINLSDNHIDYIDPLRIRTSTSIDLSNNRLTSDSFYTQVEDNITIDIEEDDVLFSLILNDNHIGELPAYIILDMDIQLHVRVDDNWKLRNQIPEYVSIRNRFGPYPLDIHYGQYIDIFPKPPFDKDDIRYNDYVDNYIN